MRKAGCLALALALGAFAPGVARAEDSDDRFRAFRYTAISESHPLRAAFEEVALLALGEVQYQLDTSNSRDWDLDFGWPSVRSKLVGDHISFDTNRFDTNMLTHPAAGWLYYVAARGNRLSIAESSFYAIGAATFWEFIGELREKVSINDLIVTPMSGIAIGETFTQLGAFFDHGRPSTLTDTLSLLFGTSKRVHDVIDGEEPRRTRDTDSLGFARDVGHSFDVGAGVAMTSRRGGGPVYVDATASIRTRIVNVPGYARPGSRALFFTDGNVSRAEAEVSVGEGWSDLWLLAQFAPIGWYEHELAADGGGALHGHRFFAGTTIAFDYALHNYDRLGAATFDQISSVHALGMAFEHEALFGAWRLRSALDAHPSFAAVHALAIDDFRARHGASSLPSVTQGEGYYYAWGATIAPSIQLSTPRFRATAEARLDGYFAIDGADRSPERVQNPVAVADRVGRGKITIGYAPADRVEIVVAALVRDREGRIGDVAASRQETTLMTGVGGRF